MGAILFNSIIKIPPYIIPHGTIIKKIKIKIKIYGTIYGTTMGAILWTKAQKHKSTAYQPVFHIHEIWHNMAIPATMVHGGRVPFGTVYHWYIVKPVLCHTMAYSIPAAIDNMAIPATMVT